MIEGSCHCGSVSWRFTGMPDSATACTCTLCRRYGALWAYDYQEEGIRVSGQTKVYIRGDRSIGFHFCANCGCVSYYTALAADENGRHRAAVNLRLAEPEVVGRITVNHFDGLESFQRLPGGGRCITDMWF